MDDLYEVSAYEISKSCDVLESSKETQELLGSLYDMGMRLGDKGLLSEHRQLRRKFLKANKEYLERVEAIVAEIGPLVLLHKPRYLAALRPKGPVAETIEQFAQLVSRPFQRGKLIHLKDHGKSKGSTK